MVPVALTAAAGAAGTQLLPAAAALGIVGAKLRLLAAAARGSGCTDSAHANDWLLGGAGASLADDEVDFALPTDDGTVAVERAAGAEDEELTAGCPAETTGTAAAAAAARDERASFSSADDLPADAAAAAA